tara:strand:+ start:61 stop:894 length:834 start_codon:yes stop_codon:yes gene_type:complete
MGKYFTKTVVPDCVMGDLSDFYTGGDGVNLAANDLIADWTAVDIPKGTCLLRSISLICNTPDGGATKPATDFVLVFAKDVNGNAPTSIKGDGFGLIAAINGSIREHIVGAIKVEGTSGDEDGGIPVVNDFAGVQVLQVGEAGGAEGGGQTGSPSLPMVIELDPDSGTNVGYDKLHVAVLNAAGTTSFETNVLSNYASGAPDVDSTTTIVVDTVDATKLFSIGDTIYNGTDGSDTAIGVVKSVSALAIELEANNAVAIANDEEILNGNPIRIKLGFER